MTKLILIMSILLCISYADNSEQINSTNTPVGVCEKIIGKKLHDSLRKNDKELYKRLKSIGIAYWLGLSFEVWLDNEQDELTQFLCFNMPQLDNAIKELKLFIRQNTTHYNTNISSKSIYHALDFYNSPRYQVEIKRIIKKAQDTLIGFSLINFSKF